MENLNINDLLQLDADALEEIGEELDALKLNKLTTGILKDSGITCRMSLIEPNITKDNWECDYFMVTFCKENKETLKTEQFSTKFYTGLGHRSKELKKNRRVALKYRDYQRDYYKDEYIYMPELADVVYSLVRSDYVEDESEGFEEWANNFGYSDDSIKALRIYNTCLANTKKVNSLFGEKLIKVLQALLSNY